MINNELLAYVKQQISLSVSREVIFNKFGQILLKKRVLIKRATKFYRFTLKGL
jgi:hypothetical protein